MIKIKRLQLSHMVCINMILQNKVQRSVTNKQLIGKQVKRHSKSQPDDDRASHDQSASAAFNFGEDFIRQSTQAIDNYDNFHQTIMDLDASR